MGHVMMRTVRHKNAKRLERADLKPVSNVRRRNHYLTLAGDAPSVNIQVIADAPTFASPSMPQHEISIRNAPDE